MKLKFKRQQFQIDARDAVCDVFEGQGTDSFKYLFGRKKGGLTDFGADSNIYAWKNGGNVY